MQVRQVIMTPDHASALLAGNINNRKFRTHWANELSKMITDGAWKLTHQAIAVSPSGRILDGQHRLHAIVKAGKPVPVLIAEGCDEDSYVAIDKGVKRSVADSLGMDKTIIEPIAYLLFISGYRADRADLVQRLLDTEYGAASRMLIDVCNKRRRNGSSSTVRAAAIAQMASTSQFEKIAATYRKFVMLDYENMPRAMLQIEKQLTMGTLNANDRPTYFCKLFQAFSPSRSSEATIRLSDVSKVEILTSVRNDVLSILKHNGS